MGENMDKAKGELKQAAGDLTGNERLEREGKRDKAKGRIIGAIEDVKDGAKQVTKPITRPKK